jgi:hypothetical protein
LRSPFPSACNIACKRSPSVFCDELKPWITRNLETFGEALESHDGSIVARIFCGSLGSGFLLPSLQFHEPKCRGRVRMLGH